MLAGFGGLVYWANQPEYAVLYSNLDQSTAGSVVDQLEQRGVKYELSGGGNVIKVPAGEVSRVRLALAKKGVPGGDRKGFSLFDQRDVVGMSSFAQRLNYQRALEGELQRTVNELEQVKSSRVHLVMPEKALFEKEQKPTKASVTVELENRGSLGQESVTGVANLVASAVEGLKTDQVTVVDQNGRVLNGDKKDQPKSGPGDELLAYQRNIETGLEEELTSLVERIVGNNQAEVRVNAAIDDEQVKLHEVEYDPFSKAARSEKVRTETRQDGPGAGGPAGAEANVPEAEGEGGAAPNANGGQSSNVREEVTNYEISKTVRDVTRPGGGVKRLTVSVLVGGQSAEGQEGFQARSEDQLANIRELVANAAGIDPERGDQVTVQSLPMEAAGGPTAAGQLGQGGSWDLYMQLARYGGYVLVTLLVLLFAVRPLMRYLREARPRLAVPQAGYPSVEGPEGGGSPAAPQRDEHLEQMEKRRQEIEERAAAEEERRDHVRSMVQQRQDNTASVIRQWLRE
ncbi:flagellar basal-body MS-ring/collar protein FliF, partial [Thiohalorhabdus sp.]|uniref:flagellar basal-body MS-ring/collar protein FliF n=1 Tax=Thiohalorhabdus sp. TaxID=3094134 RepID=UPI002FC2CCA9